MSDIETAYNIELALDSCFAEIYALQKQLAEKDAQLKIAREALEFYAGGWKIGNTMGFNETALTSDNGLKAILALKQLGVGE